MPHKYQRSQSTAANDEIVAVCPCCEIERRGEKEIPLSEMEQTLQSLWWPWSGWKSLLASAEESLARYAWLDFRWACWSCLRNKRALRSKAEHQLFLDSPPVLAYYDQEFDCSDCKQRFKFSATEQRYWYEELRFWVMSKPKQCTVCRSLRRQTLAVEKELQLAVAKLDENEPLQLVSIAMLHYQLGNENSFRQLIGRSRNLASSKNMMGQWESAIKKSSLPAGLIRELLR